MSQDSIVHEESTDCGQYRIVDTVYSGRRARVLYTGAHFAAQSGVAQDDNDTLLFDYNQRLLELITSLRPHSILLIGGGAFTLPSVIQEKFPHTTLDIVELDAALPVMAQKYFDFTPSECTQIIVGDGRAYVESAVKQYDMIIVDAYSEMNTPLPLQTIEAAYAFKRCLRTNGLVALNIIASYHGQRSAALVRQVTSLREHFEDVHIFPASSGATLWTPQNFIVTGHSTDLDVAAFMRYEPLALTTEYKIILHDTDVV